MDEKPLRLEEALNIRKGDVVKVRDSWETRSWSDVLSDPILPRHEYKVKKVKRHCSRNNTVVFLTIEGRKYPYSHYWFSGYRNINL
ncbi:MAG TPA: hypothetical protein VJG30_01890 [Candidatus Nanoarchaeia archaeon]|nr:hypothetical protein [Candidatus Nanoarchaeia archaeon]